MTATATATVQPSGDEQYMLELVNRLRSDPPAEARRLVSLARRDPTLRRAAAGSDLAGFVRILARTPALPPLAFNARLIEAARAQTDAMVAANAQFHAADGFLTDAAVARAADGAAFYPVPAAGWATGENVYAFTRNLPATARLLDAVDYLHAGLAIDWGNPDFGHLRNLLAPGPSQATARGRLPFAEVGIGLRADAHPTVPPPARPEQPANLGLDVGPVLVAQEFGWRDGDAFLTGTLSVDRDADRFYSPGEGLGGVTIVAQGDPGRGPYTTTTWDSGGYALALPAGTYRVTATGPGLATSQATTVHVGVDNVAWSVTLNTAGAPIPPAGRRPGPRPQVGRPIKVGPGPTPGRPR